MTQKEFTYVAGETRAKAVSIAGQFGYAQDDAEDIAQDVMLKLWNLHERLNDKAHLMASAVITAKRVSIDRWRTTHQHADMGATIPLIDEDSLHDHLEYTELEHWIGEQIDSLPSTAGISSNAFCSKRLAVPSRVSFVRPHCTVASLLALR